MEESKTITISTLGYLHSWRSYTSFDNYLVVKTYDIRLVYFFCVALIFTSSSSFMLSIYFYFYFISSQGHKPVCDVLRYSMWKVFNFSFALFVAIFFFSLILYTFKLLSRGFYCVWLCIIFFLCMFFLIMLKRSEWKLDFFMFKSCKWLSFIWIVCMWFLFIAS